MSRIGKKLIPLPNGVEATIASSSVTVKGPKGTLTVPLHAVVSVTLENDPKGLQVHVQDQESVQQKALWGLMRQLIGNAVEGVQKPFEKALEFVGVGYKVALAGRTLNVEAGFSHPVPFALPEGIDAKVEKQIVTLSGIDKHLVGETAAQIRRIRPPEPYKGKGIKYTTETIRRKAGKTAAKGA
ncbi:MAG: 50S ribosomal protein L6 [Patescibacteria group bacterium]|jgi:large subunit ribosomal protein L6